jgi:hypothetical protein
MWLDLSPPGPPRASKFPESAENDDLDVGQRQSINSLWICQIVGDGAQLCLVPNRTVSSLWGLQRKSVKRVVWLEIRPSNSLQPFFIGDWSSVNNNNNNFEGAVLLFDCRLQMVPYFLSNTCWIYIYRASCNRLQCLLLWPWIFHLEIFNFFLTEA